MSAANSPLTDLSERQTEIAKAYAAGDNYNVIAKRLYIAPSTVRTHLATIYRKLGVSSKIELHRVMSGSGPQEKEPGEAAAIISELALNLEDALRRERAVAEVLSIISRFQGNTEAVIQSVLGHALELCDAEYGILYKYSGDMKFEVLFSLGIPMPFQVWLEDLGVFSVSAETGLGRVAVTRDVVNITDVRSEALFATGELLRIATVELGKARSFAAIPMLAGERLIGAFTVYRQQLRPFDDKALDIARVFADQSVIAIENARLIAAAQKQD